MRGGKAISNVANGVYLSPFVRIGGHLSFPPPLCAKLQTDASFRPLQNKNASVAAILTTACGNALYKNKWNVGSRLNSTEAEWISVLKGLEFSLEKEQDAITIENDCLAVVHHLTTDITMKASYVRYYESQIRELANQCTWVGIRWIPRHMNAADKLLR